MYSSFNDSKTLMLMLIAGIAVEYSRDLLTLHKCYFNILPEIEKRVNGLRVVHEVTQTKKGAEDFVRLYY